MRGIRWIGPLNRSAFGEVYSALDTDRYMHVAIKKVKTIDAPLSLENEVRMLQSCDMPFIVRYFGIEKMDAEIWVCYDGKADCVDRDGVLPLWIDWILFEKRKPVYGG